MPSFELTPTGYRYRALRLTDPVQTGWDVYALQSGLLPDEGQLDGSLGKFTAKAISDFQEQQNLKPVDGIAGPATQQALCRAFYTPLRKEYHLPRGLSKGQIESESGGWVGNHTPRYSNGTIDAGPCQRNTLYTPIEEAFNVPLSLQELAIRTSKAFGSYQALGIVAEQRAWELASGHWNRPAYTDALAAGRDSVVVWGRTVDLSPGAPERVWIEGYISRVTTYVEWKET